MSDKSRLATRWLRDASIVLAITVGLVAPTITAPAAVAAEPASAVDRYGVIDMLDTGGPVLSRSARAALLGTNEELHEFLTTGQFQAQVQDNRIKLSRLIALSGPFMRNAAVPVLAGTDDDVREFLETGYQEPLDLDLRIKVAQILEIGGPVTAREGQAALVP